MITDFNELKSLFDQIKEVENSGIKKKSEGASMVIGGEVSLDFPHELMVQIVDKVNAIRTKFVK